MTFLFSSIFITSDNIQLSEVIMMNKKSDININPKVLEYIDKGITNSTKKAYNSDWEDFEKFCKLRPIIKNKNTYTLNNMLDKTISIYNSF